MAVCCGSLAGPVFVNIQRNVIGQVYLFGPLQDTAGPVTPVDGELRPVGRAGSVCVSYDLYLVGKPLNMFIGNLCCPLVCGESAAGKKQEKQAGKES